MRNFSLCGSPLIRRSATKLVSRFNTGSPGDCSSELLPRIIFRGSIILKIVTVWATRCRASAARHGWRFFDLLPKGSCSLLSSRVVGKEFFHPRLHGGIHFDRRRPGVLKSSPDSFLRRVHQ